MKEIKIRETGFKKIKIQHILTEVNKLEMKFAGTKKCNIMQLRTIKKAQIPVKHQGDRERVRADPSTAVCHLPGADLRTEEVRSQKMFNEVFQW